MIEKKGENRETVASREERMLRFWREHAIFEKSEGREKKTLLQRVVQSIVPKRKFIFYDGPPFATGLPHFGNILASIVKDAVPRYKTMRGYQVRRRWGWDCHGLPLEVEMEKKIGTKTKRDIEEYGIEQFNRGIRDTIFTYADEWKKIIPRIGRWVDMDNDYRTLNTAYIESVWSVFRRLHTRGFVSNGFKSLHLCPRCSTAISNAEVADNYEALTDTAVYVLFPLKDDSNTHLVAWTTTPWTLFGNVALGVDEKMEYTVIEKEGKKYILHQSAADNIDGGTATGTKKGSELIGKEYLPPFDYLYAKDEELVKAKLWRVQKVSYIEEEVGTGIVHLAPAYGAEDMETARQEGLPIRHHITKDGEFMPQIEGYAGLRPKEAGNPKTVDEKILQDLQNKELLLRSEPIEHTYPVCWRCKTPLLNYAANSWFVHAEQYKNRMVAENKKVSWVPKHIRDGRFGNWLSDAREWAVSRDRFWGAPIPAWKVEKTGEHIIVGSLEEMFQKMRPRNQYLFVRHGQSVSNEKGVLNCKKEAGDGLTEKGKEQAAETARKLKDKKPTVIFYSPLTRTRETAEYIAKETGAKMIEEPLLTELQVPSMHNRPVRELWKEIREAGAFRDLSRNIDGGESFVEVYERILQFFEKVDQQYKDTNIVVVTHRAVINMARSIAPTHDLFKKRYKKNTILKSTNNASMHTIRYTHIQRDENKEVDLHRPYIDEVVLYDTDGNPAYHTKEVFDCWFESGAMPYGSHHYPFENTWSFNPTLRRGFPAHFICEGLDQTRGWFYSLMAIGVGAFDQAPYRKVIVTGLIRAADGKKMSKSLQNYTDPMKLIEQYGADALRHYLLGSPVVRGEDLDFKDEQIDEIYKKVYARLHNCLNFYRIYAHLPHLGGSRNILDVYIKSRLAQTRDAMTKGFESYHIDEAVAPIGAFVEDMSTWYIRRSRDRIKNRTDDGAQARETLRFVLTEFAKCLAPIAPFYAEYLFSEMRKHHPRKVFLPESVHLMKWPQKMWFQKEAIEKNTTVREIVSMAHEQRTEAGIKVRQPLARITLRQVVDEEQQALIRDEVNVKEVVVDLAAKQPVALHTELTEDLRAEGFAREYIRNVQKMRKEKGFSPTRTASTLTIGMPEEQKKYLQAHEEKIKQEVQVRTITYSETKPEDGTVCIIEGIEVTSDIV
ncbi:MAG: class I tRNA ligase family protein [Candidatus Kaiserbacteria bacterium]|nr:class I tRNA ligase family protein [Candidatus Kaiserbacteria bacterium]